MKKTEEMQKELDDAIEYINSAPTFYERQKRKQEMYVILYSNPTSLSDWLKNSSTDPLDKSSDL